MVSTNGSGPARGLELVWPGKRTEVERIALPFQVVETINQSRATREQTPMLAGLPPPPLFEGRTNPDTSWKNKLIWGENKYVMASLLQGDPSIGLEPLAGKIDLIYIDPPFATGQDFSYRVHIGDEEWVKEASAIEEKAYRDTWGRGLDSYIQMMYERLLLIWDLLSPTGILYLHVGPSISHTVKLLLDEVFGPENYINEIIWKRTSAHADSRRGFGNVHDAILVFARSSAYAILPQFTDLDPEYERRLYRHQDERGIFRWADASAPAHGREGRPMRFGSKVLAPPTGAMWRWTQENIDRLWEEGRIILSENDVPRVKRYLEDSKGTPVGSLWTDIAALLGPFSPERTGFQTQKPEGLLERILEASSNKGDLVADFFCGSGTTMAVAEKLGRRWIGCDLSRYAIQVSRKRMLDIPGCKPFQVLNLGKYERQHWQVNVLNGHQAPEKAVADYYRFILALYRSEPISGYTHLHGQKAGRWVHVGATDAPVTRSEVMDAVRECQAHRSTGLDVLGWEWEMGLHDTIREEARRMGVDVRLLVIPREVMDKRAVQAGDVRFYELAYLKTHLLREGRTATVRLESFIIPSPELVPEDVRGKIKKWSDYIDFWAVDWEHQGDAFHNQWQTYRTRKSPTLQLLSDPHPYPEPGRHHILVKVIDIFGNDTTQLLEVVVD